MDCVAFANHVVFVAHDWNHECLVVICVLINDVVKPQEHGGGDMEGAQHTEDGK